MEIDADALEFRGGASHSSMSTRISVNMRFQDRKEVWSATAWSLVR